MSFSRPAIYIGLVGLLFALLLPPVATTSGITAIELISTAQAQDKPGAQEENATTPDAPKEQPNPSSPDSTRIGPFSLLLIISLGGAFGGFVDGLRRESEYMVSYRGNVWRIGSWGDPLTGIAAAITVFTVADALFNLGTDTLSIQNTSAIIKIIALAVLSGFAGIRMLNPLSEKLVRQLAESVAKDAVASNLSTSSDIQIYIQKGNQALSEYAQLGGKKAFDAPDFDMNKAKGLLTTAASSFDLAQEIDARDKQALLGKSLVLRRQADIAQHEKKSSDSLALWEQAIKTLGTIILTYPNSPKAYYNRACYRVASGISKQDAQKDLEEAIRLQPGLKKYALKDEDFDTIEKEEWFKKLI